MSLGWFNARLATEIGAALADSYSPKAAPTGLGTQKVPGRAEGKALQELLKRADRDVRGLRLNLYKKARLASSFKWRLIENGLDKDAAGEVTRTLLTHLSLAAPSAAPRSTADASPAPSAGAEVDPNDIKRSFALANKAFEAGEFAEAATRYEKLITVMPNHFDAVGNLGAAYSRLGRYKEAETLFRGVAERNPSSPDAHYNLGTLLRWKGDMLGAESSLRRALKLKPTFVDARYGLGITLLYLGRIRDARARFEKVLKASPRHAEALAGLGEVASLEGRFDEARALFNRAIESNRNLPAAWAGIAATGRMTQEDVVWRKGVEEIAASGLAPIEESSLRFALGKYFDDIAEYSSAFEQYRRANELQKTVAEPYGAAEREALVTDLIRCQSREAIAKAAATGDSSERPVFVVGMMRSGTSLTEQIIASHPEAAGAGELNFWSHAVRSYQRRDLPDGAERGKLAAAYLRLLTEASPTAARVVDKAPLNADHLGLIHAVFPKARIIHMRRDAVDTCLSCYFQQFAPSLNFSLDLKDLAHYSREQDRLMRHWREVLPAGTILEVPYADMVEDPEKWSRRIIEHLGLTWNAACLDFQKTKRSVVTASAWQVRQKIYKSSVGRWRHYEQFIAPLKSLRN